MGRIWQNLAAEESLILQNKPIGTERVPKGHQKSAKRRPKYIKKLEPKKGERHKREREGKGRTGIFGTLLAPLGRLWVSTLAPAGSRRVDPLGISLCIWRYLKKMKKHTFINNYTAKVGELKYI